MINLFFDHQTYSLHRFGGVSRVFTREIEGLQKYPDLSVELGILKSENENLITSSLKNYYFKSPIQFKGKTKLTYFVNGLYSRFRLATNTYDIVHPTLTDLYFLPYLKKSKLVITIHDIIPILYPDMMGKENQHIGSQMKYLATRADHILTISQASKNDILSHLGVPDEKVTVALLGGIDSLDTEAPQKPLPTKYILFDGNRAGYKNFDRAIKALAPLLLAEAELFLVYCGRPFTPEETALVERLGVLQKTMHMPVQNDALLMHLHKHATLFIYPSRAEGFGIPLLQSLSFGTPIVASDIPVFHEVARDGATYFDPTSEESIREVTKKALSTTTSEQDRAKRKAIASSFSWEKHVEIVHNVYTSLI